MTMLIVSLLLVCSVSNAASAGVTDLNWLAGRWFGMNRGTYNEEAWLAPRACSMVGMHRDIKGEKFSGFEFFRIVEDGGALIYLTQPNG